MMIAKKTPSPMPPFRTWQLRHILMVLLCMAAVAVPARFAAGDHPPLAGRETLQNAWADLSMGRWIDAEKALNRLVESSDEETCCQAHYTRGILWQYRRPSADPLKAEEDFAWILKQHPKSAAAPWAILGAGRIPDLEVLHPDLPKAIALYRRVLVEYPDSEAAQEAVMHLANALFESGKKEGAMEGVSALRQWITEHPHPGYLSEQELLLGKLLAYPIADYSQAVAHLSRALNLGLRTLAQQTATCWAIASLAEQDLKDHSLAIQYYTRFIKDFPRHRLVYRAKLGLKRLGAPVPETEDLSLEGVMKKYGSGANLKSQAPNSR